MGAGRTDSGVHALGQVVAFDLDWAHGEGDLQRALNANLPRDLAVIQVSEAPADFHPRFQARSRRYRYTIYSSPVRRPLDDRYAWRVWPEMQLGSLHQAAEALVGRQDFASFGTAPEPGGHTVRTVFWAEWRQFLPDPRSEGEPAGGWWSFEIEADAFLYQMVRSLVGTMKQVGVGERSPEEFREILTAQRRGAAGPPAPACGLCLMEVTY